MGLSGSIPIAMPPTQTTSNPFTKSSTFPQPQNLSSFSSSHSTIPIGPKNNNQIPLSNNNPFASKQNQVIDVIKFSYRVIIVQINPKTLLQ
jgi:hypothetical protein